MKILQIDFNKMREEVSHYKNWHENNNPIILINNDTIEYIKNLASNILNINSSDINTVEWCGCKVAIANWLPFGEVELR